MYGPGTAYTLLKTMVEKLAIYSVDSIRSPLKTDVTAPLQYRDRFMDTIDHLEVVRDE